mgnify:CR=1 FL=1
MNRITATPAALDLLAEIEAAHGPVRLADQYAEAEVTTSPVEAPRELRQHEADQAVDWFKAITGEAFG